MLKNFFLLSAMGLIFAIIFNGCGKKTKVTEAPKTGGITVTLTPSTQKVSHGEFHDISENTGLGFSGWKRGETLSLDSVPVQTLGSFWGSIPDC